MGLVTATAGGSRTMDPVVRVAGRRRRPVPMFSTRLPVHLDPNPLARALVSGDGRVYSVTDTCTDGSGNSSSAVAEVTVPHDMH